jgi:hypothetical protein
MYVAAPVEIDHKDTRSYKRKYFLYSTVSDKYKRLTPQSEKQTTVRPSGAHSALTRPIRRNKIAMAMVCIMLAVTFGT